MLCVPRVDAWSVFCWIGVPGPAGAGAGAAWAGGAWDGGAWDAWGAAALEEAGAGAGAGEEEATTRGVPTAMTMLEVLELVLGVTADGETIIPAATDREAVVDTVVLTVVVPFPKIGVTGCANACPFLTLELDDGVGVLVGGARAE